MSRLLSALLLSIAALGLWVMMREPDVAPPGVDRRATSDPIVAPSAADVATDEGLVRREAAGAATRAEAAGAATRAEAAGATGDREFEVQVEPSGSAPKLVPVELLFGERDALQEQVLTAQRSRDYRASWPMGAAAELPWAVDFAFPTAGRELERVAPDADHVRLRLPPVAELKLLIVAHDGEPCHESAEAEIRVLGVEWPAGRWRPLPFPEGSVSLPAELGLTVEVRGRTSSGRSFEATLATGRQAGEDVEHPIRLARGARVEFELAGLPARDEDPRARWQVRVFGIDGHTAFWPRRIEREGLHFELFGHEGLTRERPTLLVMATEPDPSDPVLHWGTLVGHDRVVTMQRCEVVAEGRVVADSYGWIGPPVELRLAGGTRAIRSALSDGEGRFRIHGPDPRAIPLVVTLRQADAGARASASLPLDGPVELHVR